MKDFLALIVLIGISFVVWAFLNYWLIRASVRAALGGTVTKLTEANQILLTQTAHLYEVARHQRAQLDLMLLTARSHGLTEDELAPVTRQLAKSA